MDKLCSQITEKIIHEISKDDVKSNIEKEFLDPLVLYLGSRLYPYIVTVTITIVLLICSLFYLIYVTSRLKSV